MSLRSAIRALLPHLSELSPWLRRHRRALLAGYLCTLATSAFSLAMPMVMRSGIAHLEAGAEGGMHRYALRLVGLAAGGGIFLFLTRRILIGTSRRIEYEIRNDFFAHVQTLSLSFFNRQRVGDLMSRATNDLNAVRDVLGPGIMYGMNTATVVAASVVLMIRLDPILTLLAIAPLPLLAFLVRHFAGEMHRRSRAVQDHAGLIAATLQENINGVRVLQAYTQEAFEADHFDLLGRRYMDLGFRLIRYRALFISILGSLIGLLMLILLWAGGTRVIRGSIGLDEFVAFLGYLGILTWPVIALGWVLSIIQRGEAAMARMLEIRRSAPEIESPAEPDRGPRIRGEIAFERVRFSYEPGGEEVLCGIDLAIPAGSTVAVVGATGSGKTTLVSLIPRLHDPSAGAVRIDGIDARRRDLAELREAVAAVPQESFLFSDTVRANVAIGRPESSEEEIAQAVALACLTRDIETFPQGLETRVGERGITLSGGQRQRVALARALLADPAVLILDDAFSSVDRIKEAELLENLRGSRRGRTTLLIAHRISTVREADRIFVLEKGLVAEAGTHQELIASGGIYAAMERRQRLTEEIERAPAA